MADTREEIVAELSVIGEALRGVPALYERRLALWKAGRGLDPPMTQKELADASDITEIAVTLGLRKDRQAAAAKAADAKPKRRRSKAATSG